MDEDDQKELVESMQREAAEQSVYFQKIFGYGIGGMAIVVSLVFPLLCPDECSWDRGTARACWSHSVLASSLHAWTVHPFVLSKPSLAGRPLEIVDVALQSIPFVLWLTGVFFSDDEDHFHLALLIGNAVTFFGARLIYWDIESIKDSLGNLDAARYKHKTL